MSQPLRAAAGLAVLLLAGCGSAGNFDLPTEPNPEAGGGSTAKDCATLFSERVQPRLDYCRSCHVPGGLGDVPDGRLFQLSGDPAQDAAKLKASWEALGGAASPPSRILRMAAGTDARSHSGGAPWPLGSAAYVEMAALLQGYVDPAACLLGGGGGGVEEKPLLGSARGGHAWFDYCAGQPDDTPLPADPRALIRPGVNGGKAVYFNAYWKDCHADPALVGEEPAAKTCGELRRFAARGEALILGNGAAGAGSFFAGTDTDGFLSFSADTYASLWKKWGLRARPDNFDSLAAERYGLSLASARNPYPLPGEDPNASDGGSGQLPTALTQLRGADGRYSGTIGVTCHVCHSGAGGSDAEGRNAIYGNSNSLSEFPLLLNDTGLGLNLPGAGSLSAISVGKTRGTNNALALQIIVLLTLDAQLSAEAFQFFLTAPNGGSLDAPAWWNMGHRGVKFQDGFLAMDALRSDLGFFIPMMDAPLPFDTAAATAWVKAHARAGDTYLMSLKSPEYPLAVDRALAEQGAILFHAKDLWGSGLNNPVPRPEGGNGSCASCHGVYSPRYAHDPAYLDSPALEGQASYIVPRDLIGTDPARVDSDNEAAEVYGKKDFFAYPETVGGPAELDCGPQNRSELRGRRAPGYLAPPLYGVWASAPYFHNGSVPDVWGVLDPDSRPAIWRRQSTPARADQAGTVVMGYDSDLSRAYDPARLGWKYETLACGVGGAMPYVDCNPGDPEAPGLLLRLLSAVYGNNPLLWYLPTPPLMSSAEIERRKIYNTLAYSQGRQGHAFSRVLSEAERRALIEYLKTL